MPRMTLDEEGRKAAIKRYQDYARGGSHEADARVSNATNELARHEQLKRADDEAFRDLFGSLEIETQSNLKATETVSVKQLSTDKNNSRNRYVQYYSNTKGKDDGGNLNDSLI